MWQSTAEPEILRTDAGNRRLPASLPREFKIPKAGLAIFRRQAGTNLQMDRPLLDARRFESFTDGESRTYSGSGLKGWGRNIVGERFRPTLLRDETASEDEFESKGHQRTADALADTISDLAEFGGGAIGIEGKWGSGKSTVVGLAETTLAERRADDNGCDFRFFTFDLWTHQSDDFRRSLLEELLNFIENDPVLKRHKDFANKKRDLIRDRIRITTNRTVNRFSLTGLVVLALAPLIPLIYAWFGPSAIDRNADTLPALWAGLNNFQQFSLLLVGSVILTAALSLMTRKDNSITDAASKMLQIFKRESEERTEKQHIREEDPTTVEFHSTFGDILSEIQSPKVRIVFVLDNVDRLPSDLIPATWGSVRSLFSKAKKAAVSSEPVVIVPYDRQHILQVFKQDRDESSTAYIREDLFRKTFSQVLRVAPPISVDWKKYFDKRVSEAFGTHIEPSDAFKLRKLLDLDLQIKQTHPTPRQINTYINDVGILRSQWGDAVPFPALALFVLHRQDFEGNIAHLKSGPLEQRFLDIADLEDWRRDFVSLVFNVESGRAYQVLLGPDVEEMLTNPAPKNLSKLTQMDGFADVLTDLCHDKAEEWLKGPPRTLSAVMENLAAIQLEPEPHPFLKIDQAATILAQRGAYQTDGGSDAPEAEGPVGSHACGPPRSRRGRRLGT